MFPITVAEKETSISKYLLRMWERRYDFPKPRRDEKGERLYSSEDIEKLKLVKNLMAEGYRPSKIIKKDIAELKSLMKTFIHDGPPIILNNQLTVIVTTAELHEAVTSALRFQDVKRIITITKKEDLRQLEA